MKTNEQFNLINGEFSKEDAKEMLLKLINSKIQFHQAKNFSTNEMLGQDDANSIKRIPILLDNSEKISTFINQLSDDVTLHIEGEVKIVVR
jgi:hypothetical protein